MTDESPDQMLLRVSRQIDELSRTMSEMMVRQNAMDNHIANLIAQTSPVDQSPSVPPHANGVTESNDGVVRLKSTTQAGWKAIRYRKVYLDTIPEFDGKASMWSVFSTKLRLTLDQAYEWSPLYLRYSERLESPPNREDLIAWIEMPEINYDRSDLIEFSKDLCCILCNRTASGTGPSAIVHRVMESEVGWMRGPCALYEIQREALAERQTDEQS